MSIRQAYETAADWTSNNPTLDAGEIGIESDTGLMKIGDGSTAWTSLDYAASGVDQLLISEGALWGYTGSPTQVIGPANNPFIRYWSLSASTSMGLSAGYKFPVHWGTYDAFVWTYTPNAGAGDVRWIAEDRSMPVGTRLATYSSYNTFSTTVAPSTSADQVERVPLWTAGSIDRTKDNDWRHLVCYRWATDASDTYNQIIGVLGIEFVRAS